MGSITGTFLGLLLHKLLHESFHLWNISQRLSRRVQKYYWLCLLPERNRYSATSQDLGDETSRMAPNKSGKGANSAIGNFHSNFPLGETGRSRSVVIFNFDKENSSNTPRFEVTRRAYSAQNSPVSILKSSQMNRQCQSAVSGLNSSNAANLSVDRFRPFGSSFSLKMFILKNGNFEKRTHCESSSDRSLSGSSDKSAVLFKGSRNDPSTELLRTHVPHRKENSFNKPITQLV